MKQRSYPYHSNRSESRLLPSWAQGSAWATSNKQLYLIPWFLALRQNLCTMIRKIPNRYVLSTNYAPELSINFTTQTLSTRILRMALLFLFLQTWKQKVKEMKAFAQGCTEVGLRPDESLTLFNLCFSSVNHPLPHLSPQNRACWSRYERMTELAMVLGTSDLPQGIPLMG